MPPLARHLTPSLLTITQLHRLFLFHLIQAHSSFGVLYLLLPLPFLPAPRSQQSWPLFVILFLLSYHLLRGAFPDTI